MRAILESKFTRIIEYIDSIRFKLARAYANDPEMRFRASNLFYFCCAAVLLMTILLVLFTFEKQGYLDERAKSIFGIIFVFIIGIFFGCIRLVLRGRLRAARFTVVGLAMGAVLLAITTTGGFPHSVASPAIMIPIVICYCLYPARSSLLTTSGVIGLLLVQWGLIGFDLFDPPNFVSTASEQFNSVIVLLATISVICSVLGILDASSRIYIKQASASMVSKTNFLANTSHEIRTPMNGIIGLSEVMMKTTKMDADQTRYMEAIHQSGTALLTIINDILDYSRLEAGQLEIHASPFNLYDLVNEIRTLLTIKAVDKGLSLHIDYPENLPKNFIGDAGRIRQVLINLMANAIKFTESGSVTLQIDIKKENEAAKIRISVKDTGIGIPANKLSSIFERFSQADSGTTQKYGGTGLGLSISQKLIELMGGEIGVMSKQLLGSEFWFTIGLPFADLHASANEASCLEKDVFESQKIEKLIPDLSNQALILSHQDEIIQSCGNALSKRQYRVFHTASTQQLTQWLHSLGDQTASTGLIVLDEALPAKAVESFCQRIQQLQPKIKILQAPFDERTLDTLLLAEQHKLSRA